MTLPNSASTQLFDLAVALTFGLEGNGELSVDPDDDGNWTGGRKGVGVLRGTRWGFSAAAFPLLDIEHLDKAHAVGLAFATYWMPAKCASAPNQLAVLLFDAAFQHGPTKAIRMLQRSLSVRDDGVFGDVTMKEVAQLHGATPSAFDYVCTRFQAERMVHMTEQPSWLRDGYGLGTRLFKVFEQSKIIADAIAGAAA